MMSTFNNINKVPTMSKEQPTRSKKFTELFEIEPSNNYSSRESKIHIKYNETIFFDPTNNNDNTISLESKRQREDKIDDNKPEIVNKELKYSNDSSIELNLKLKHNETGMSGFIKNISNSSITTNENRTNMVVNEAEFFQNNPDQRGKMSTEILESNTYRIIDPPECKSSNFIYVPCINCNNLVHIEDIENHSNTCTRVKEEVIVAESSQFSYHTLDFKLKKLQEHIHLLKNNQVSVLLTNSNSISHSPGLDIQKDGHYISLLVQYISDSINLCKIDHKAIMELKKILTNIDTLIHSYKGTISTLVLIERARLLVFEKISVFREDFKQNIQTKKLNERKTGTLNTLKIQQLEKEKEEKRILAEKLETEKEMIQRKVNNLRKSPNLRNSSTSVPSSIISTSELQFIENDKEDDENECKRIDANKIYNKKNVIDDINSDIENASVKSEEFSDCTSMTSSVSVASGNNEIVNPESIVKGLSELRSPQNRDSIKSANSLSSMSSISSVSSQNLKNLYQEFLKILLQVKFEKVHNTHQGQKIPDKTLFKECIRQNIPQSNWAEFIVNEFRQPGKYAKSSTRDNKLRNYKNYLSYMETIKEEN